MKHFTFCCLAVGMAVLSGCSTFERSTNLGPTRISHSEHVESTRPIRIMGLWQPGEGDGIDGTPGRGFVGQIYFFGSDNPTPIEVAGDVKVFVFDDVGTPAEQAKPIHEFDFEGSSWRGFSAKSAIGPCYNIYVPYPRKGLHEANCALRLKLSQPNGNVLFSELMPVRLDGYQKEDSVTKRIRESPEYNLEQDSEEEWRTQAATIGVHKAGRIQAVDQSGHPARNTRVETNDHGDTVKYLGTAGPKTEESVKTEKEHEIKLLEDRLTTLYSQRLQEKLTSTHTARRGESAVEEHPILRPTISPPQTIAIPPNIRSIASENSTSRHGLQPGLHHEAAQPRFDPLRQAGSQLNDVDARVNELRAMLESE